MADRGKNISREWKGEILEPEFEVKRNLLKFPIWFRKCSLKIVGVWSPLTSRFLLHAYSPRSVHFTHQFSKISQNEADVFFTEV